MVEAQMRSGSMSMMEKPEQIRFDEEPKKGEKPQTMAMKDEQLTWSFWQPMVISMVFLLLFTDLVGPMLDCCCGHGLMKEAILFLITMLAFATVVFFFLDWNAAGMLVLVGAAIFGAAIAILFFAFSLSIVAFSKDARDPVKMILTDLSYGLRGLVRVIMLCTLVDVVSQVAGVDWARLVMVLAFLLLAVGLALAGVIGDLMAHIFIRFDKHFFEGEFIFFDGDLVQIQDCHWRHVVALSVPKKCIMYIPNNALTSSALVNPTTDVTEKLKLMDEELKKLKLEE
jgi:small-conductance mechanosensitive channel